MQFNVVDKKIKNIGGYKSCTRRAYFNVFFKNIFKIILKTRVRTYIILLLRRLLLLKNDFLILLKIFLVS